MGHQPMINQLTRARATYDRAYLEKLNKEFGDDENSDEFNGKIDIS
jgi:hypothetical protein